MKCPKCKQEMKMVEAVVGFSMAVGGSITKNRLVCINEDCGSKTLDEDTKELCKLAKELDDKKIMFKAGCE